jgi:hypothetical protein
MAVRASADGATYSAASDLSFVENQLATLMHTVGLNWDDIDTTTIDDIITAIRTYFNHVEIPDLGDSHGTPALAADDYLKTQNAHFTLLARRLWFWRKLAIGVS